MKLFTVITAAAITFAAAPAASAASECSFNGRREACQTSRWDQGDTTSVTWSDGKIVNYTRFACVDYTCSVRITEDNGRVTHGTGTFGRRGFAVRSNRGNVTQVNY